MIELTCPQCQSELEIDEGFRGGVCRCFKCGTLMTVPDEPQTQRAERLDRPDLPEGARPQTPAPAAGAYRTSSGRTVELSRTQVLQVPTARKRRMGVRIGTMAAVILLVLLAFGAVIYGGYLLLRPKLAVDPTTARLEEFGYDAAVNPFTLNKPNFMGIAATSSPVVFMSDSSAAMRSQLDLVKQAMLAGIRSLRPDQQVQLAFWNESGPVAIPDKPTAAGQLNLEELQAKMQDVYAGGGISGAPAFGKVTPHEPGQIILVARQLPMELEIRSILQYVNDADARLDVVLLDGSSEQLKEGAQDTGGTYVELPASQLAAWYEEYKAAQ